MANVRQGNTHYVDSTGTLDADPVKVLGIIVTATSANAVVVFQGDTGSANRLDLRVATSGATQDFDFSARPISFPKGIKVSTLTNAIVTVIYN